MRQEKPTKTTCYYKRLKYATGAIARYYERMIAPAGLSAKQYSLLSDVGKLGTCSMVELAQAARLEKSTITRNLRLLRDKGYVTDLATSDAREHQITLTPAGREKVAECRLLWEKAQQGMAQLIGAEEMERLGELLLAVEQVA